MKILVINAYCLTVNSSANLCHIAYIQGLIDLGHEVTVLSSDEDGYTKDESIVFPKGVKKISLNGKSFYEQLSNRKSEKSAVSNIENKRSFDCNKKPKESLVSKMIHKAKRIVLSCYGVHEIYSTFVSRAKKIRFDEPFDYVISLSSPAASHLVAYNLLITKHVTCKHWIQIWEDPWYGDIYGFQNRNSIYREEKRLLSFAEKVCYVSPLTLKNRKRLFPESAEKMYWQPLPYYYKNDTDEKVVFYNNHYGYFGDYVPASRDLEPFYRAAVQCDISVNICGNPKDLFSSTEQIHIYPRLPLNELNPIEACTNVLIFLCNRLGGQIPGKIYQYSATDKTILFILDGTPEEKQVIKEYFQKYNRYVFCENTVEDITRAINDIENGNIGNVVNESVEAFNPKETVRKILDFENG